MDINLDELERFHKAATPGPWSPAKNHTAYDGYGESVFSTEQTHNLDNNLAYIVAACNAVPKLIARVRELEERIAEHTQENSGHKRVIHMLENKVLALKGKPIPMEPRQFIPSSNRSNAKEAGE